MIMAIGPSGLGIVGVDFDVRFWASDGFLATLHGSLHPIPHIEAFESNLLSFSSTMVS